MGKMLGYGEDALTLWALSIKLDMFLEKIHDNPNIEDYTIFYRPSFGRGRRLEGSTDTKAEFGEFDAILMTPTSWYLIENKWDNLRVQQKVNMKLHPVQILRHNLFKWYFENWERNYDYSQFYDKHESAFPIELTRKQRKIAPKRSLLSENIEYILGHKSQNTIKNVFLYFHQDHYDPTVNLKTEGAEFISIKMGYPVKKFGNFIEIER